jgi:hypothetical protein
LGKAKIVLARAEKKKSPAGNPCWSAGDQAVLAFLAEVFMQQRFVTTIRELPLTLTWFLTWSINPLVFTLLQHLGARLEDKKIRSVQLKPTLRQVAPIWSPICLVPAGFLSMMRKCR